MHIHLIYQGTSGSEKGEKKRIGISSPHTDESSKLGTSKLLRCLTMIHKSIQRDRERETETVTSFLFPFFFLCCFVFLFIIFIIIYFKSQDSR